MQIKNCNKLKKAKVLRIY
jgi:hypothetical protein